MDTSYIGNLQNLFGGWSILALIVGFGGAFLSYHFSKRGKFAEANLDQRRNILIAVLPWAMWMLAVFIGVVILPASMAYSGPVPTEYRRIWRYDKYFAALIALAFALVFELNSLRIPELRRRFSTWLCLMLCVGAFWFFLEASVPFVRLGIR
jgi:hypothetical protein